MMLKKLRYLLLPFSMVYGIIIKIRNFLFDKNIFHAVEFDIPVICVGNLSTGGTGKTPMAAYLIKLLTPQFGIALISRGYKRKTKGLVIAGEDATAATIGDELMQLHSAHPEVVIAAGKDRLTAIPAVLQSAPDTDVILLDDAFQYRWIKPGLNMLLTSASSLYVHDIFLPAGNLRDSRSGAKRADLIIVTKCNPAMTLQDRKQIISAIAPLENQKVFFTTLAYLQPEHLFTKAAGMPDTDTAVLLVAGVADPVPLLHQIQEMTNNVKPLFFGDHHDFTSQDVLRIKKEFENTGLPEQKKMIITTEKDGVRLLSHRTALAHLPIYVYPVKHSFLFDEGDAFDQLIVRFAKNKKPN